MLGSRESASVDATTVTFGQWGNAMAIVDGDKIVAALRGAFARDVGRERMLALAAERIRAAGPPYTSVYLYLVHGDELVLEAWSGRETEHTRIPVGRGVCGAAV